MAELEAIWSRWGKVFSIVSLPSCGLEREAVEDATRELHRVHFGRECHDVRHLSDEERAGLGWNAVRFVEPNTRREWNLMVCRWKEVGVEVRDAE